MVEFPTRYDPKGEAEIYAQWEESGAFQPSAESRTGDYFSIVLPPPNVTGTLHVGHAVMLAIEDMMVRYHRMKGDRTVWIPGVDHAAIATQYVVEKKLKKENVQGRRSRHDLGREAFVREVEQFAEQSKTRILEQIRAMGASLDWSRFAYTFDEQRKRGVRVMFKAMYETGILYRGNRIVNWCPRCKSTLADDEVEYKEEKTTLLTFRYDEQWPEDLAISTTRPETKFGDTAVALHPDDPRAATYAGKSFIAKFGTGAPELEIRVITDPRVDRAFGTGVVGVTPAHSFIDAEFAAANDLPSRLVITEEGTMDATLGTPYGGLKVKEARGKIVAELRERGLILKEEPINHNLSVCYRCETPVEPLPKLQWFVDVNKKFRSRSSSRMSAPLFSSSRAERSEVERSPGDSDGDFSAPLAAARSGRNDEEGEMLSLKDLAIAAVGDGPEQITILPERFTKEYFHWMENLRDWCISRQIWFGHRIPAWYRKKPTADSRQQQDDIETYVGVEPPEGERWEQDPDTLDTWFSAGMWTFSTLGWPSVTKELKNERTEEHKELNDLEAFHPTSVLETGYDILFFWIARMILMTEFALETIPFKTVYLHGLVRDAKGRKMSKSLGNVIDPLTMSEKYGADAVRLALFIGTSPGQDTKLDEQKIAGYAKFVTKIWNIGRYVVTKLQATGYKLQADESESLKLEASRLQLGIADHWILTKRDALIRDVTAAYEAHEYSKAAQMTYDFAWHEFADWYIEATKVASSPRMQAANCKQILTETVEIILKLLHPAMPFVTETLWRTMWESRIRNQESEEPHLPTSLLPEGRGETEKNFSPSHREGERLLAEALAEAGEWVGDLITQPWPAHDSLFVIHDSAVQTFEFTRELVTAIRQARNEDKIEPKTSLEVTLVPGNDTERVWCADAELQQLLKHFGRLQSVTIAETISDDARTKVRGTSIYVARST